MKVTIRIHRASGLEFETKSIEKDGKVTLEKPGKRKAGWRPKIVGLEAKHLWFGRVKYFADIWPDAEETWSYDYKEEKATRPVLSKDQVSEFGDWDALRRRAKPPEGRGAGTLVTYLTLFAVVGMGIIEILVMTGRLKL